MKPWEVKKTVKQYKRLSGEERIRFMSKITQSGYGILITGIRARKPDISEKELHQEVRRVIWEENIPTWKSYRKKLHKH